MARRHNGATGTEHEHTAFHVGFTVALDIAIHAPELAQWAYLHRVNEDVNAPWNDWTEEQYHEDAAEEARLFAGVVANTGAFEQVLAEARAH